MKKLIIGIFILTSPLSFAFDKGLGEQSDLYGVTRGIEEDHPVDGNGDTQLDRFFQAQQKRIMRAEKKAEYKKQKIQCVGAVGDAKIQCGKFTYIMVIKDDYQDQLKDSIHKIHMNNRNIYPELRPKGAQSQELEHDTLTNGHGQ